MELRGELRVVLVLVLVVENGTSRTRPLSPWSLPEMFGLWLAASPSLDMVQKSKDAWTMKRMGIVSSPVSCLPSALRAADGQVGLSED